MFKRGAEHHNWKGKQAGYKGYHMWLVRNFGKARMCENSRCLGASRFYDWALVHGKEHDHNVDNYIQLCRGCHLKYDYTEERKLKMIAGVKNYWRLAR